MRVIGLGLLALSLLSCTATSPGGADATSTPAATARDAAARVNAEDDACARRTMNSLVDAMNAADETRLTYLLGGGVFQTTRDAVGLLLARSRAGERWTLARLDINGHNSYYGGIDFGVYMRRTGPNVNAGEVDAAGKGVVECPEGRFKIFGLGP